MSFTVSNNMNSSVNTQSLEDTIEQLINKYGRETINNLINKKNKKDETEPLLDDKYRSFVAPVKPKYQNIWDLYKEQQSNYWKEEELDFSRDYDDFITLNKDEQQFIKMILAFFAASDGIVNFNLSERFTREITNQEILIAYRFQMMMEDVHSITYAKMLENIIRDKNEREYLFNAIKNIPCIKKMADWAFKWIDSSERLAYRIVAFAIVEGVFFSGAFASIFWIKKYKTKNSEKKSFMNGLIKSNGFIARDEGLHTLFACEVYHYINNKLSIHEMTNILSEAVSIAKEFMTSAISVKLIGMNNDLMCQYIEYVADRLLNMLGYNKIYKTKNPFKFMETIGLKNKSNFFEEWSNDYQDAHINNSSNNTFELSDNF